jgi:hypothetical protein
MRLTIHCPRTAPDHEQALALGLIREFASVEIFDAVDTEDQSLKLLKVRQDPGGNYVAVTISPDQPQEGTLVSYLGRVTEFGEYARRFNCDAHDDNTRTDLLILAAHQRRRADLLVTLSTRLLVLKEKLAADGINVCTPKDAVGVIGLFLRSRDNYNIRERGCRESIGRWGFYLVLTREQLPALSRYFSACVYSSMDKKDDTALRLGESVFSRARWALEARDFVAMTYHQPHTSITSEMALYHFGYLTVLLGGMFDAEAQIAKLAYGMRTKDAATDLWRKQFQDDLVTTGGTLLPLLQSQFAKDVGVVLKSVRNTVHSVALKAIHIQEDHVTLPEPWADKVCDATDRLGSRAAWGIRRSGQTVEFEPYPYACQLVSTCFAFANDVADATDVLRLFPSGADLSRVSVRPATDGLFAPYIRERVVLLGT